MGSGKLLRGHEEVSGRRNAQYRMDQDEPVV